MRSHPIACSHPGRNPKMFCLEALLLSDSQPFQAEHPKHITEQLYNQDALFYAIRINQVYFYIIMNDDFFLICADHIVIAM